MSAVVTDVWRDLSMHMTFSAPMLIGSCAASSYYQAQVLCAKVTLSLYTSEAVNVSILSLNYDSICPLAALKHLPWADHPWVSQAMHGDRGTCVMPKQPVYHSAHGHRHQWTDESVEHTCGLNVWDQWFHR
jgi:hypothetical protein